MSLQHKKFLINKLLLLMDNWSNQYWEEIRTYLNTSESLKDVEEVIPVIIDTISKFNQALNTKDTLLDAVQDELELSDDNTEITMLQEILDKHLGEIDASESNDSEASGRTIH